MRRMLRGERGVGGGGEGGRRWKGECVSLKRETEEGEKTEIEYRNWERRGKSGIVEKEKAEKSKEKRREGDNINIKYKR